MIARQIAFARQIPPRKLIARLRLLAKRKLLARAGPLLPRIGKRLRPGSIAARLPGKLFTRCVASLEDLGPDRFALTFLNERREFGTPIDWHDPELRTGTQLWLLNLHYMEYLAEAEDALFERILLDWIGGNQRYVADYWKYNWNSYSLSIRVVTVMQEIERRRDRLSSTALEVFVRSVWNQLHFLAGNLETDIGGNHIIKNIKALAWGSAFFEGKQADRWRDLAIRLLGRELDVQVLADGVHFERSPSYHAQVFADLLDTRHALGGDPLNGALDEALGRMAQPLADLAHPDGDAALFNDAGLHMSFAPGQCLDVWHVVSGAVTIPQALFAYPDGGYFGIHTADTSLIVDMGPIGPDELPAHAHGDVGSFEVSVAGERLIVDQGVFEYSVGVRRHHSRSAANHNVLHIEGGDQAEFYGAFRCGRKPIVQKTFDTSGGKFRVQGMHDGYSSLDGSPRVERSVEATSQGVAFHDRIHGDCHAPAFISMLIHPDAVVETADEGLVLRTKGGAFALVCDLKARIEDAVYWPDMGVEVPAKRIRLDLPYPLREARWELQKLEIGNAA